MTAIAFILFAVTSNSAPVLFPLAAFESKEACVVARDAVSAAIAKGEDGKMLICVASDSLEEMAKKNMG
jgi:hypothetical protein